jgi:hypothetical protein
MMTFRGRPESQTPAQVGIGRFRLIFVGPPCAGNRRFDHYREDWKGGKPASEGFVPPCRRLFPFGGWRLRSGGRGDGGADRFNSAPFDIAVAACLGCLGGKGALFAPSGHVEFAGHVEFEGD